MTQMNRKARSFEQIKAEQAKAEEEARVANTVEIAEGIFVDMRTQGNCAANMLRGALNLCFYEMFWQNQQK